MTDFNPLKLETIHESFINGQRKQAVNQINEYGLYDFWSHYKDYLSQVYADSPIAYSHFSDACISYHRVTNP